MSYTKLEILLILQLSNRRGNDSKSRDSGNPDEFLLMLRDYPRRWPTIRLPIDYWELSKAEDREVSNDNSRKAPCRSWAKPEWFEEINKDEFLKYIETFK